MPSSSHCYKQTWPLVGTGPSHSTQSSQKLGGTLLWYCFDAQFDCQSKGKKR